MKKILLLLISIYISTEASEPIHSSVSTYYENRTYYNSIQKEDAFTYGVGADIHHNSSAYKLAYEYAQANTKQPPLTKDLINRKIFLRYRYGFKGLKLNINYINILNDNIAITSGGRVYGAGFGYDFDKKISANFTQYFSDYKDFNTYQSDLRLDYKTMFYNIKIKLSSITKYITIDEKNKNSFTKNASGNYFTSGVKFHAHYKQYHFGAGAYFGKRVFAIMDDGFKIQHHAMEFDKTYAFGIGRNIYDFVLRFQYIYQNATELPMQNKNVSLKNSRLILNYKF